MTGSLKDAMAGAREVSLDPYNHSKYVMVRKTRNGPGFYNRKRIFIGSEVPNYILMDDEEADVVAVWYNGRLLEKRPLEQVLAAIVVDKAEHGVYKAELELVRARNWYAKAQQFPSQDEFFDGISPTFERVK